MRSRPRSGGCCDHTTSMPLCGVGAPRQRCSKDVRPGKNPPEKGRSPQLPLERQGAAVAVCSGRRRCLGPGPGRRQARAGLSRSTAKPAVAEPGPAGTPVARLDPPSHCEQAPPGQGAQRGRRSCRASRLAPAAIAIGRASSIDRELGGRTVSPGFWRFRPPRAASGSARVGPAGAPISGTGGALPRAATLQTVGSRAGLLVTSMIRRWRRVAPGIRRPGTGAEDAVALVGRGR